ncbi:MAG: hypothetical protein HN353_12480 [Bdellovibrionales bacterium]|jgi:hypothetical protein|nr:hypothetical protein [Bdellovibrionales bacterium]MBT3526332.1 hypothetical protein [Bdellovibrionales bacterium]MBT7669079.1 hypothetical protein [Bdellovibrionales bacterium]MBT7765734.1 hypothetical protein [Bdellovibrionales bacterium]
MNSIKTALLLILIVSSAIAQDFPISRQLLVTDFDILETMDLRGNNDVSQEFVYSINQQLYSGLEENNFLFTYRPFLRWPIYHAVMLFQKDMLQSITRIPKDGSCSSIINITPREITYGQSIKSLTEGICGTIATVHSLLKLDLYKKAEVIKGTALQPTPVKEIKRYARTNAGKSMTIDEMKKAHAHRGTVKCTKTKEHDCSSATDMAKFVAYITAYMNHPTRTYDCTMLVRGKDKKGNVNLSHVEHIEKVTIKSGTANVKTLNGLDQGDHLHTIPSKPGSNNWSFGLKGCKFTGGANPGVNATLAGKTPQTVGYFCCRK